MNKLGLRIVIGYLLLTVSLCAAVWFIVRSARAASGVSEVERAVAVQRNAIGKLSVRMIEAGMLAENATLQYSSNRDVHRYIRGVDRVDTALVELKDITADLLQRARLDSLRKLLMLKREGVVELVAAMRRETHQGSNLEQEIANLRSGRKPINVGTQVKVSVHENSEQVVIDRHKKRFWDRLGDAFRKPKDDTLSVNNLEYEPTHDSTQANVNISDTVANILQGVHRDLTRSNTAHSRNLQKKSRQLRLSSAALSERIVALMDDINREQQRMLQDKTRTEAEYRRQAAWQMGIFTLFTTLAALGLFIWVWRDMSRVNRYRMELEEANQCAEDLMKRREQLLLTISHDIKAPVNTILGYLSLMKPLATRPEARRDLDAIDSSAHHLLNLVTALLDYHKLEAGGLSVNRQPTRLNELIDYIGAAFQPIAQQKGLTLRVSSLIPVGLLVSTDAFRLRQIIENLLGNAIKYTQKGEVELTANWSETKGLNLTIRDTGCGLSRYDCERIFQPFTRVKGSEGQEGTGLGLSITLKLVALLGGKIDVKSQVGFGSTFTLLLPDMPRCEEDTAQPAAEAVMAETLHEAPTLLHTVALLDDDLLQLQLSEAMLKNVLDPMQTIYAFNDAEQLFAWLAEGHRPDLLLTDIEMPGLTGYDVLERVHRIEGLSRLPVVATTSHSLISADDFKHRGFADVLFKPFTQNDLRLLTQKLTTGNEEASAPTAAVLEAEPTKATDTPHETAADKKPLTATFAPLLAFADGDPQAEQAILSQFAHDCNENLQLFAQAAAAKQKATVCRIAHKMRPTFTLIGSAAAPDLQTLDERRNEAEWTEADEQPCRNILFALQSLLFELADASPNSNH